MITINCCRQSEWKDLTQGQGDERHYYCGNCKRHVWRGQLYTANQWEKYINEADNIDMVPDNVDAVPVADNWRLREGNN